jgi:hypothetical protein
LPRSAPAPTCKAGCETDAADWPGGCSDAVRLLVFAKGILFERAEEWREPPPPNSSGKSAPKPARSSGRARARR